MKKYKHSRKEIAEMLRLTVTPEWTRLVLLKTNPTPSPKDEEIKIPKRMGYLSYDEVEVHLIDKVNAIITCLEKITSKINKI
jgi:hypothetical protein